VLGSTIIVTLEDELSDKVGSLVTVIMGLIFVVCVLAFRRGIVGEAVALYQGFKARRSGGP
jgi:branched-chain amino acid transport system permease protein